MRSGPNKTRAWRKIKRKVNPETGNLERYGRRFRNVMMQMGMGKQSILPIHAILFKKAGIDTPLFDAQVKSRYNTQSAHEVTQDASQ